MKWKLLLCIVVLTLLLTACQTETVTNESEPDVQETQTQEEPAVTEPGTGEQADETAAEQETGDDTMTKLLYQGHGSYRITAADGTVMYVDPFAGEGYDVPADIVLITHQHSDHNQIDLVTQNPGCTVITNAEALADGVYQTFSVNGIDIEAVEAYNDNHDRNECVGFLLTVDGVKLYAAGDTSRTDQMETFADLALDYALLPADGNYNMDVVQAVECADLIGAKHTIPIHLKPGELFDRAMAESFNAAGALIVEPGEEIGL